MASNMPAMRDASLDLLVPKIHRRSSDDEVQDADVSVQIEPPLDLGQIALADEGLLEPEQRRDRRHAAEIQRPEAGNQPEPRQTDDSSDVHRPRDDQRTAHAESNRKAL